MTISVRLLRTIPVLQDGEYDPYETWRTVIGSKPVDSSDIVHKLLYAMYDQYKLPPYLTDNEIFNAVSKVVDNKYILSSIFICLAELISYAIYYHDVIGDYRKYEEYITMCNYVVNKLLSPFSNTDVLMIVDFNTETRLLTIELTSEAFEYDDAVWDYTPWD